MLVDPTYVSSCGVEDQKPRLHGHSDPDPDPDWLRLHGGFKSGLRPPLPCRL